MIICFSQVEVMTLLQQEKASEKSSLEKQIEDAQQSLDKKEKEILVVRGELQEVNDFLQLNLLHRLPWDQKKYAI